MITAEFKAPHKTIKPKALQSVHIINNIEGKSDKYYQINPIENDIVLNLKLQKYSLDQFLFQIYDIGIRYSEVFIHRGDIQNFSSLDEFICYAQLAENNKNPNRFTKHSSTKEPLSKEGFCYCVDLYINEHFMSNRGNLVTINYDSFKKGSFYYNFPYSPVAFACELEKEFWAFSWYRYI